MLLLLGPFSFLFLISQVCLKKKIAKFPSSLLHGLRRAWKENTGCSRAVREACSKKQAPELQRQQVF